MSGHEYSQVSIITCI